MKYSLLLMLMITTIAMTQWMEQTDWSGGPGVTGPDWEFHESFLESSGVDWSTTPGQVSLQLSRSYPAQGIPDLPAGDDAVCSGSLVSSLCMVPMGTDWAIEWGDILWTCYEPDTTDVYFHLRTGNSAETMGPWGDPITESGTYLGSILPDDILLVQYMVILESDDPYTLPILFDVIIEGWYPGGVAEGAGLLTGNTTLRVGSNPSSGAVTGWLTLGEPEEVRLAVYDTTGRLTAEIFRGDLTEGEYAFGQALDAPGVYLLVLETGRGSETTKVTVTAR